MDDLSDEELMLRVQQANDQGAFAELFSRYRGRITSYACRLTRDMNEGESLAQETFLRLLQKSSLYNYPRRFSTWLFTIARNLVTDFHKKKRAVTTDRFELVADSRRESEHRWPEAETIREERLGRLNKAIGRLPVAHREVLILRAFYDMSYREIAEIIDCPESTARSRMDYALKELRKYCGEKPAP